MGAAMGAALPWIAVGASVAGTLQSANAQSNALQYQAQVARNNATIANEYATRSLQAGDVQAENAMEETSQRQGAIRAAAGASGFDVNSGSSLRVQEGTAMVGAQNVATIRNNARMAAYGYEVQGIGYQGQGALDTAAASNTMTAGELKAGTIIADNAAYSSKWSSMWGGTQPPAPLTGDFSKPYTGQS